MNYGEYHSVDVLNGEGTRCSLFVSGCVHNCKGCFNQKMLNPKYGKPFTKEVADQIIADLQDTRINRQGISLLGGDPLFPGNCEELYKLCQRIKTETTKDIWLWTGYVLGKNIPPEACKLLALVDVVIDGPFVQEKYDPELKWMGSSNQRITVMEV